MIDVVVRLFLYGRNNILKENDLVIIMIFILIFILNYLIYELWYILFMKENLLRDLCILGIFLVNENVMIYKIIKVFFFWDN